MMDMRLGFGARIPHLHTNWQVLLGPARYPTVLPAAGCWGPQGAAPSEATPHLTTILTIRNPSSRVLLACPTPVVRNLSCPRLCHHLPTGTDPQPYHPARIWAAVHAKHGRRLLTSCRRFIL